MSRVDLPPPDTPVTQVKTPSGISAEMFLRLLARAPLTRMRAALLPFAAEGGQRDLLEAGEILAGQRIADWP